MAIGTERGVGRGRGLESLESILIFRCYVSCLLLMAPLKTSSIFSTFDPFFVKFGLLLDA